MTRTRPSPSPVTPSTPIRYTAVGASDVVGYGSSAPCLILFGDCPDSKGYVFVAAGRLRSDGYAVTVTNRGIPTATISAAFQQLGIQYGHPVFGNLLGRRDAVRAARFDLVTIFAGGNDVNVIMAALGGGAGAGNQAAFIDQQVQNFAADYATLVDGIRDRIGAVGPDRCAEPAQPRRGCRTVASAPRQRSGRPRSGRPSA